jgi:ubiquinone/menaquinone biosynthesis C-methylase UbiE
MHCLPNHYAMNQEAHWNNIAGKYDDEVFDVFKSDKNQILKKYFSKHSNKSHNATDFGCGIGKAFEYLSPAFKQIQALDISEECIGIAKTRGYKNITYKRADLTNQNVKLPPAQFGLCCNVAILPELKKNRAIIKTVSRGLSKGGSALFVVPSMESMFFASWRLVDWYKKEGVEPHEVPDHELNYFKGHTTDIIQGIIYINGVPTKHYSHSEIHVLFEEAGLAITAIEKLEYSWETEFDSPPAWLKAPFPWDWMVECKKIK